ncbi:hypothetical protein RJ55_02561 [Drechmeria coniospora]|nr:hypothetical protein RJ55_02561 [Drechmeria coniospora]
MSSTRPSNAPLAVSQPSASACSSSTSSSTSSPWPSSGLSAQVGAKRGRRSNPKVKTGCANCKLRRIKCDEKRPACSQCLKSNKTCSGYPPPSRGDRLLADVRIAPKPPGAAQPLPVPAHAPAAALRLATVLPPRRARRRSPSAHAVPPPSMTPSPTTYQPSDGLQLHHADVLYFDLFRLQTASELSGYFNSTFWARRVVQECHSEKAIRHAVVALGALYKTLEQSSPPASPTTPGMPSRMGSVMAHWQVAVKQYSEACNEMLLLKGDNLRSHRTRLMASVLLACFDSFIGDHRQAITQIQTGLGLLEQLHTYHPHHRSPSPGGHLEEDLVVIFTRLAIQAKSYDMAFHFPQPYVIRLTSPSRAATEPPTSETSSSSASTPQPTVPHRFDTLVEARQASDILCEKLLRFIERLQIAKNNPSNVLPANWRQYGLAFKDELDSWSEAFEPILRSRFDPAIGHLERSGTCALKMFQINTNILFMMMFCDTEVQFDGFMPHFKAIVDLGWEVVGADEKRAATACNPGSGHCHHEHHVTKGGLRAGKFATPHIKPSFAADLGIVPPLFVVATKCRDPSLRRQAIQLLRSSARREGMWDSELAANIGHWIMQVEEYDEQAPRGAVPTRPIPEEKRVMIKTVDFDLRARFADLRVGTRAVDDGCPDDRFRNTRITW